MHNGRPFILETRVVTGAGGGPEKTILNSPRFLVPFGYDVLCAYMYPPGDRGFEELRQKAEALGAPLLGIEDRGPWDLRSAKQLLRLCRQHRVTIWHAHDYKSDVLGLLLRRFWPMKLLTTLHGFGVQGGKAPLYNRIDRFCLRWFDRVICVSEDLREICIRSGVKPSRCLTIPNAIDAEQYARREPVQAAKQRLGFAWHRLLVGAVGRLSDEKNFAGLISVFAALVRQGIDAELVIIGEGPQRPKLEALRAAEGMQQRVRLPGYCSNVIDYYQAMDVFALSSIREGLPNVLLEAMALEVPVVATRVAGVPTLVEHEYNGLLVKPGDLRSLGAALNRLLRDAELRSSLAAAGRRTILDRFTFSARMAKVRAVFEELLHTPER